MDWLDLGGGSSERSGDFDLFMSSCSEPVAPTGWYFVSYARHFRSPGASAALSPFSSRGDARPTSAPKTGSVT